MQVTVDNLHEACVENQTNNATGQVYGFLHQVDLLPLTKSSIYIKTVEWSKNAIIDFEEF